jgi:3'-phosphoadenosine 5'-phosphosulfate sulfotransferase (PAPS reductase)/FAD synthetase
MKKEPIRVLSFGAGVQSTALLLKSATGVIPKVQHCVFADTGYEPKAVYEHLEWCVKFAKSHDIPVHIVKAKGEGIKNDIVNNITKPDGSRFASVPFFTIDKDGKKGMGRRQCTNEYKIQPVHKFLRREILGLKHGERAPKEIKIEQWMGITFDEVTRAKPSREKWLSHVYPYLNWGGEFFENHWRRYQVIEWLEKTFPEVKVPRSACVFCPYHSNEEWAKIKQNKKEWDELVEFDKTIRNDQRPLGKNKEITLPQYLHKSCKPIDEVDFRTLEEKGQGTLWDNECEGMCGM